MEVTISPAPASNGQISTVRVASSRRRICRAKVMASGSSPRRRGTPHRGSAARPGRRFIPARAGNTGSFRRRARTRPVHPRAGGEHAEPTACARLSSGSSPRGRGTRHGGRSSRTWLRFIPARAGNTICEKGRRTGITVHPRAGGEHGPCGGVAGRAGGSSPRGRGTHGRAHPGAQRDRFIPARAGNTCAPRSSAPPRTVHPRAGGEHDDHGADRGGATGSSPRGRGTRGHSGVRARTRPVHPRAGGEHPAMALARPHRPRFIPARAGNTVPCARARRS